jgi:ribosomal protein L34E
VSGQRFWDGRGIGSIAARSTRNPTKLRLWVRRKRGNRKLECTGCGRRIEGIAEIYEREVRDLPWSEYRTTVVIELYRVRCPNCGIKAEKVELLPSKAPFSKRFEGAVGQACESAAVRRVARQFGLAASTNRGMWRRRVDSNHGPSQTEDPNALDSMASPRPSCNPVASTAWFSSCLEPIRARRVGVEDICVPQRARVHRAGYGLWPSSLPGRCRPAG